MAREVIWTERAEADLDEIWQYTLRKWGEQQADAYVSRISSVIEDERKRRLRARSVDFVSAGLFRMREVRHLIYFKLVGESVQVIRVLHDSMDETMHLP